MIQKGSVLRCIDASFRADITEGSLYIVRRFLEDMNTVMILDDVGERSYLSAERFVEQPAELENQYLRGLLFHVLFDEAPAARREAIRFLDPNEPSTSKAEMLQANRFPLGGRHARS